MSVVREPAGAAAAEQLERALERHRGELTGYCYRMLGSPFEAEDAVQEALLRAWKAHERFEGRAALRSWLYKIATNVCLDMLKGRSRRARPMDLGPAGAPEVSNLQERSEVTWISPIPDALLDSTADPEQAAISREGVRLAFVAALQHLPARQRAALILCEVLRWQASEAAELLESSVAAINSALQRARATLQQADVSASSLQELDRSKRQLLARYVEAFEAYDMDALALLLREDAIQSMPPYDLWLQGREHVLAWFVGPGIGCRGSRLTPALAANGTVAFGQYRVSETGEGHDPWALQVLELADDGIAEFTAFLDTDRLFPLFGLPPHLPAAPADAPAGHDADDRA